MESFDKIRQSCLDYANKSLSLEGVAIEKLCTLIAYSIYKNQVLQLEDTLESSFSTSTKLNSRIYHAANENYSVPRGKCPILKVSNVRVAEKKSVEFLDQALFYNGYYFYFTKDYTDDSSFAINTIVNFDLICSSKVKGSVDVDVSGDLYSVELSSIQNVSSDYKIIEHGISDKIVPKSEITEDPSVLYKKEYDEDSEEYKYIYKYLVTTIPSYGVKITRRADTTGWGDNATSLTFEYIPYSETVPDVTNLTVIPGFAYVSEYISSLDSNVKTELTIIPFEERLSDLKRIYSNATASIAEQNSVVTEEDLIIHLNKQEDLKNAVFVIYTDTEIRDRNPDPITVTDSALVSTLVYYGTDNETAIDNALNDFKQTFSVPRNILKFPAKPTNFEGFEDEQKVYVEAFPKSKELTNTELTNLCNSYHDMIGQTLTHAKFEADIVKLGFDYVRVYTDENREHELDVDANVQDEQNQYKYKYPAIHAIVLS